MSEITGAKERCKQHRTLRTTLPEAKNEFAQEKHHSEAIEKCAEEIRGELRALESFSVGGLLAAVMGRKEQSITQKQEELSVLQEEQQGALASLQSLQRNISDIESELQKLSDVEDEYKSLCEEKRREILDCGGEGAQQLLSANEVMETAAALKRKLERSIQVGDHLLERLDSMTNALGRAQSKMGHSGPLGMVAEIATNALARKGASGPVDRVHEGVQELVCMLQGLNVAHDAQLTEEIRLQFVALEGVQAQLSGDVHGRFDCEMGMTLPVMEQVEQAVGVLEDTLKSTVKHVKSCEETACRIVEKA